MFAPRGRAQGITRGLTNKSASFHTRVKINTTCYSTSAPFRFVSCTATDESTGICNTVRVLALPQLRQQDNLPIRKFQSVMISVPFGLVDLLELRHLVSGAPGEDHSLASDFLFKGKLRARKQAHGHATIVSRSETACRRVVKAR